MIADARTDEALMAELCQGRETCLAELVRRYQNDIFRFCLHYLKEVEVAREMTQETFVRVYTSSHRFDVQRKFRPWVLCIARNLCLNELKRKKTVSLEALEDGDGAVSEGIGPLRDPRGENPSSALMAAERRDLLMGAVGSLNDEARELVTLRFFERLSAREIAEVMGSTEGAVRTRLHRVLAVLRAQYRGRKDEV